MISNAAAYKKDNDGNNNDDGTTSTLEQPSSCVNTKIEFQVKGKQKCIVVVKFHPKRPPINVRSPVTNVRHAQLLFKTMSYLQGDAVYLL